MSNEAILSTASFNVRAYGANGLKADSAQAEHVWNIMADRDVYIYSNQLRFVIIGN